MPIIIRNGHPISERETRLHSELREATRILNLTMINTPDFDERLKTVHRLRSELEIERTSHFRHKEAIKQINQANLDVGNYKLSLKSIYKPFRKTLMFMAGLCVGWLYLSGDTVLKLATTQIIVATTLFMLVIYFFAYIYSPRK